MTIRDVIAEVRQRREPGLPETDAIEVINDVEARIRREITDPRGPEEPWARYTYDDMDAELTAPEPYDRMYVHAVLAEIDARENQIGNLSNARQDFNGVFYAFARWYLRTHRPERGHVGSGWFGV